MKLIFIRHAKTTFNEKGLFQGQYDCSLSHDGIEETKAFKKNFSKEYDFCYCSTLKRAKQTSEIINDNKSIIYDERLVETSFGKWEKTLITKEKLDKFFNEEILPIGAESKKDVNKRVISFIEEIRLKHDPKDTILIITHGGVISRVKELFAIEGLPPKNLEIIELEI